MGLVLEEKYRKGTGKGLTLYLVLAFQSDRTCKTLFSKVACVEVKAQYLPLTSLVLSLSSGELQNVNLLLFHCFISFLCTHSEALKYKDHT